MLARNRTPDCCSIDLTEAVEDYLKALWSLSTRGSATTTSAIATELGVSAPSVSTMMQRLAGDGLVERTPHRSVQLTAHGEGHARAVVRRHRLLETFLVTFLDVPWDEVHAEAEVLEHALSDRLCDRIDARLGHPETDPHGDPIPPKDGSWSDTWPDPLRTAPAGARFRVERVSDRDSAALRYLAGLGIGPGRELTVVEWGPFGGPLWVEVDGARVALGVQLADLVYGRVRP